MNKLFLLAIVLFAFSSSGCAQKSKSIFNGKNLDGWKIHGTEKWYVEDGLMICESGPDKAYGYLSTEKFYDDFELDVEFLRKPTETAACFSVLLLKEQK